MNIRKWAQIRSYLEGKKNYKRKEKMNKKLTVLKLEFLFKKIPAVFFIQKINKGYKIKRILY